MRTVYNQPLDRYVSALAFGCASLGSRVSPREGRRALDTAYEYGVTWYDVAPSYGDGEAEKNLGRFLRGRRSDVVVCTKFGIVCPSISPIKRAIRPFARKIVAAFPRLRPLVKSARPVGVRAAIDPQMIKSSVMESLRRLQTDYIDVLAIHDPSISEASDPATFEVLEDLKRKKYIRAISIAGAPESIVAAISSSRSVQIAQFADGLFIDAARRLRNDIEGHRLPFFVTHSVFADNALKRLESSPKLMTKAMELLHGQISLDAKNAAAVFLLSCAFSNNPDGVVIASMFSRMHIVENCSIAKMSISSELTDLLSCVDNIAS